MTTPTKTRMPLAAAEQVAAELTALLAPVCHEIHVVGSVRRRRPDPSDVELVVVPIREPIHDLFGEVVDWRNFEKALADDLKRRGVLADRLDKRGASAWGERYQRAIFQGVPVDLFSVFEPAQLGLMLAIRTGPADFSHRLVTPRAVGGVLPNGWRVAGGAISDQEGRTVHTPREIDVFDALGLPWVNPEERR